MGVVDHMKNLKRLDVELDAALIKITDLKKERDGLLSEVWESAEFWDYMGENQMWARRDVTSENPILDLHLIRRATMAA